MEEYLKALAIGVFIAFLTLYALDMLPNVRSRPDLEELHKMTKEELIQLVLSHQVQRGPGYGRYITPIAIIATALITAVLIEKHCRRNCKEALKLLKNEERTVIEYLIKRGGECYQYEISKLLENKVKAHRLVKSLEDREIITLAPAGKTHKIILNKDIYKLLK